MPRMNLKSIRRTQRSPLKGKMLSKEGQDVKRREAMRVCEKVSVQQDG